MSAIFGLVPPPGAPVEPRRLESMREAIAHHGPDGGSVALCEGAGLGHLLLRTTPEAAGERLPSIRDGIGFTAAARVDNRADLCSLLGLRATTPDGEIIRRAYLYWGERCVERIFGDWAFAVWHPDERRLFLARDHDGMTGLYYSAGPEGFAFASDRKAILAIAPAGEIDELYLAQVLVSWMAHQGERTILRDIHRLPPAHTLTLTPSGMTTRRYWRLEDTPPLELPRREDYVEALREVFDEAVRARLRCSANVGTLLSGGLDSGSVAATAAGLTSPRVIPAFHSVTIADPAPFVGRFIGDELPYAKATAAHAANIDLHEVRADEVSPIAAIRAWLDITCEPAHAPSNAFWLLGVRRAARDAGCRALLIGQTGNGTISWTGDAPSQRLIARQRLRHALAARAKRYAAGRRAVGLIRHSMRRDPGPPWASTAIHPDLAAHLDLRAAIDADPMSGPQRDPKRARMLLLYPGLRSLGSLQHSLGAAFGLEVRDPTADARVEAFTISVPDRIFYDRQTGIDRWLIREAMRDRLPDLVRLNTRMGHQAGDLVPRLRICPDEVEAALDEVQAAAPSYLDVVRMREVWLHVKVEDSYEANRLAVTVLMRGLMAGIAVGRLRPEGARTKDRSFPP